VSWLSQHWLAAVLMTLYTLILFYHANIGRRASHNLSDYYVGGRNLSGLVVGVSFFATFASTNSYIGHAGKGYEYGLPWMTMAVIIVIFTYLSWTLVAPRLRRFTSHWDALTLPDYLAARFGAGNRLLRLVAALVIIFSSLLYLVAIFKGAGNLFQQFLDVPYTMAVAITLLIVMCYTSIGGFVSVVRTDVLQGVLMLLGSVTIFAFVFSAAGGSDALTELTARPDTRHLFTLNAAMPFVVLLGIALSGSLKLLVDPRQVSRFFALRDERSVRVGVWVSVIGILIIQLSLFPVGIFARLLLDGVTDTDMIMPTLITSPSVFPLWVADCLVIAMVAAAMSSMDSVLLVAASVLYKDVVETVHPTAHPLVWTRIGVVALSVLAALVALRPPGGIVEITIFSGSLYAVCFLPAILFGLHWRRGNAWAVLASMITGILMLVGWLLFGPRHLVHEVFPALGLSCVVYVLIAWRYPPTIQRWPDT
jgi:SSS family transporter